MGVAGRGARRGLAQRRKAQGFTQESLAACLEVERSTVVRWEAGKSQPQAGLWPKLAATLQVTSEQLTDLLAEGSVRAVTHSPLQPPTVMTYPGGDTVLDNSSSGSHDGSMFELRRVLMGCIPDTPPGTQIELTAAVAHAWDLFFSARFSEMERVLPTVLASAYSAAEAATGELRRQINISLAQLLHASSNLLGYVAQEDLAALALVRADALAAESGDDLTRAAIRGSQSWLFAKNGMYDDAAAYADQAASGIEPRLSTATPRHIAIWGELLCYAAFAASRTGDYREARRYLRLCESAGTQLEDEYASRPEASNVFGHTSAASFGVINETGANRPREALKLATLVRGGGTGIPPTLRSRRLINVAQAQVHNRDDAGAVDTLRHACSMAPEFVGHIPLAHTLTNELLTRRDRQRLHGLVGVAELLGVAVQHVGIRP
ncbi:helix-turn-helix transcriptional regulator [Nocardia vinacea]|uniref:helix-turn-helix transcriptional regulator n=1 Tax=Nocardia vinacea TaxID=96468 RepID=UPI002E15C15E|nr:helix-turn-helix transcriptional regulator [Nocardia vinacea]